VRDKGRNQRKLTRILPLLLLSILVTTASAAVYNLLYMQAMGISAEAAKVYFVSGADGTAAGATIGTDATYVKFTSMAGWPNATRVYEDVVGIKNGDSSDRDIVLSFDSWSGDTTYVTIYVKVFNGGGTQKGSTITVGAGGSNTGTISITAGATYRVQWEIKWSAGALSTYRVSVTLTLRVNNE